VRVFDMWTEDRLTHTHTNGHNQLLAKLSEQQISQLKMLTRLPAEQLEKLRETGKISDANMASALA